MNFLGQLNWGSKPCAPPMNIKASPKIFCIYNPWPSMANFHGLQPWVNQWPMAQLSASLSTHSDPASQGTRCQGQGLTRMTNDLLEFSDPNGFA